MKRFLLIVALTAPLFGCIIVADYVEPTTGDLAEIEFVNDSTSKSGVQIFAEAAECRHRANVKPMLDPGTRRTVRVAANRDIAFTMSWGFAYTSCISTRSFHAEAGKKYVMRFETVPGFCGVIGTESGHRVELVKRELGGAFDENSPFCAPLK